MEGLPLTNVSQLRALLAAPGIHPVPGCYDALSTLLARQAGFPVTFLSGYGVAASRFGLPDVGLVGGAEVADTVRAIAQGSPGFPFIVDGDQGYGNAMNVRKTVIDFASAGAAGIMIEDQVMPKRCGHMAGKSVAPREEARLRIVAAAQARASSGRDIVIMARTDALASHGFDEALARMLDAQEAGADILFLEAMTSEAQMEAFNRAVDLPTASNNFAGGQTPYLPRPRLGELGFKIMIDPTPLFSVAAALKRHFLAFEAADEAMFPPRVSFPDMARILGVPEYDQLSERYKT